MLTRRDIICLSTQDWDGLWTRKQRFMNMFADGGNRVLYIETPVHLLGLDVLPRDWTRFFRFLRGPRPVRNSLWVATLPILLPMFQMSSLVNSANQIVIAAFLRRWMAKLGFRGPLLWIYTPFSGTLIDTVDNSGSVYECVDEFRAARGLVRATVVGKMEDELLRKVDLTVVTQENLLPHRRSLSPNAVCIPNGADVEKFVPAAEGRLPVPDDLRNIPSPRLGLVGHIHYWIDLKLIRYLAEKRPNWSFVLIGPVAPLANVQQIRKLPNVHLLGRRAAAEIPAYLQAMDCCLNPYVVGELSENCSPLKLYEYLAAGKPVVSTDMPEARKFPTVVRVAQDYQDFLTHCQSVVDDLPAKAFETQRRLDLAAEHSWSSRFVKLNKVLDETFFKSQTRGD
jgi:glycosyltransferase involved in cell wall biosynthesis